MTQITLSQEMFNQMMVSFSMLLIVSAFLGGIVATWFNDLLGWLVSLVEFLIRRFARKPPLLSHKRY